MVIDSVHSPFPPRYRFDDSLALRTRDKAHVSALHPELWAPALPKLTRATWRPARPVLFELANELAELADQAPAGVNVVFARGLASMLEIFIEAVDAYLSTELALRPLFVERFVTKAAESWRLPS